MDRGQGLPQCCRLWRQEALANLPPDVLRDQLEEHRQPHLPERIWQ